MSEKRHILLLSSWYPNKAGDVRGSFFREQALALHKEGHKVGVVAPIVRSIRDVKGVFSKPYGLQIENDNGVQTYRWHSVNFTPRLHEKNISRWLSIGKKLFESYVKDHGMPDIIHVHSLINAGYLAFEISSKYKIPYIVTEHSTAFARGLVTERAIKKLSSTVKSSSKNIAVSNEFKELLNHTFDIEEWCYIPNIVNSDFLAEKLQLSKVNKYDFEFINICLLDQKKRVDILIKAFSKAFKGGHKIKLKIGGDGPEKKNLELLVKSEGVSDQVSFLGLLKREQVRQEISRADAFVLSSEYETFGVVVIEALALGKPVIATRCGGPESIITPEVGYLVTKNSVDEMATAMLELYENQNKFHAENIRKYCAENFSEEAVVRKLEVVYEEVLNSSCKK